MELGKVSPPESFGLLERGRLFARLDQARKGRLVWISGPAGAGKTSLVSSWAQSRGIPAVWYQIDEDDNDPATFFHFMGLANGRNNPLPHFSPEQLAVPARFARRFFSQMFQGWSTQKILVLDNYHLLPGNSVLHQVMDTALELLPTDSLAVIASRHAAPEPLAHRYAYASTVHIGWDELRFTDQESRELGRLWGVPDTLATAMHERLLPNSPDIDSRPWPIRVYTLGRFSLLIDDVPLTVSGKSPKKPLLLLKALIALGGRGVATHTLATALWEDSEGNAMHALDMAVSRLRKLLGHESAVLIQDGKLSLNDKLVWVDIQAFERSASVFEALCGETPGEEMLAKAEQTFKYYSGIFLAGDEETPWLLGRRDRLHTRFLRLVASYGEALEKAAQHEAAAACYQRALEIYPLAEEICQRLMNHHLAQGEMAQTLEVYRRCRHMLSVVLGVAPSPKTESLAARARQQ